MKRRNTAKVRRCCNGSCIERGRASLVLCVFSEKDDEFYKQHEG